jgi:hypothetical protein
MNRPFAARGSFAQGERVISGSTIGGAIGAVIGFYVTGGSPQGAQWGWMIGPAVGDCTDPVVIESIAEVETT